jgi:P pilus assembly chaperone PapD
MKSKGNIEVGRKEFRIANFGFRIGCAELTFGSVADFGFRIFNFSNFQIFKFSLFVSVLLFSSFIFADSVTAQGNLLITPRRIVFEGTKRVMDLNLANTGQDTAKYNVSIVQYRMKDDGSFEEITQPDPGQNFADKNIRFFPRTVTLGPNEAQVVKMQVTNTDRLAPGEYRSHVYFRAVPKQVALGEEETLRDTNAVSIKLIPIFGITIPVIIRVGESTTRMTLSGLKMEMVNDTTSRLEMTFNRSGNMSVYGDLKVMHVSPAGIATQVGVVNGIAVYTPNAVRRFRMDLDKKANVDFRTGSLKITYSAQSDTKPEKFAEAELVLQ